MPFFGTGSILSKSYPQFNHKLRITPQNIIQTAEFRMNRQFFKLIYFFPFKSRRKLLPRAGFIDSINCCGIALKCSARRASNQSMGFIVGKRFLTWNSCVEALSILCFAYRSHFPVCDNSVHFPAESIHHSGAPSGVCGATPTFRTSERL